MFPCMTFGPGVKAMEAFSVQHIAALLIILTVCLFPVIFRRIFDGERIRRAFRYGLAILIAFQLSALYIWYAVSGEGSVSISLPIQLCDVSQLLAIVMLVRERQRIMEILYYWGAGGAIQALLTPDMGNYDFPHFVFWQFFLSHCLILLTCCYMIAVEHFRPSRGSVIRTFVFTNLYAGCILPINRLTGGNYLFLSEKPAGGSLLDFLGPWPWYLLSLEGVALLVFTLLYLPFVIGGGKPHNTGISV